MKPLTLQSAHDKQSETIQKQAHKIAMLVKQVEANGECHKGLTAKPCHCEAIESAYDKLKEMALGEAWKNEVVDTEMVDLIDMTKEELIKLFEDETGKRNYLSEQSDWSNWLIERLAKKDAEVERLGLAMRNKEQTASTMWHNQQIELQSLRSKMDKAQKVWIIEFEGEEYDDTYYSSLDEARATMKEGHADLVKYHQVLLMEVEEK